MKGILCQPSSGNFFLWEDVVFEWNNITKFFFVCSILWHTFPPFLLQLLKIIPLIIISLAVTFFFYLDCKLSVNRNGLISLICHRIQHVGLVLLWNNKTGTFKQLTENLDTREPVKEVTNILFKIWTLDKN